MLYRSGGATMHSHCWCTCVSVPQRPTRHHDTPPTPRPPSSRPLPQCHPPMTTITCPSPSPNNDEPATPPQPHAPLPHFLMTTSPNDHHYLTTTTTALPRSLTAPHNHDHPLPLLCLLRWPKPPLVHLPHSQKPLMSSSLSLRRQPPPHHLMRSLGCKVGRTLTTARRWMGRWRAVGDRNTGTDMPRSPCPAVCCQLAGEQRGCCMTRGPAMPTRPLLCCATTFRHSWMY
jgi:hypothetical protein